MEYYIIGERELVLAFGLVGVKGTYVSNKAQALEAFNKATGQTSQTSLVSAPVSADIPKVLILTEDVSVMLDDEVRSWQLAGKFPLIVEIPGIQGKIAGKKSLTDSIREAVGIRV